MDNVVCAFRSVGSENCKSSTNIARTCYAGAATLKNVILRAFKHMDLGGESAASTLALEYKYTILDTSCACEGATGIKTIAAVNVNAWGIAEVDLEVTRDITG